jgi:multidrug efflux pump subunit AcrB
MLSDHKSNIARIRLDFSLAPEWSATMSQQPYLRVMGAIMCMGVATANSILVVSFATEKMMEGSDSVSAALEAGFTRFRPVLMTALAMIIGMVPMALGLGDGGEQNAPLGRAVIGGLIFATVSTLLFVPAFFSVLQGKRQQPAQAGYQR